MCSTTRSLRRNSPALGDDTPTAGCGDIDPCTPCMCEWSSTPSDEGYARSMMRGSTTLKTAVGERPGHGQGALPFSAIPPPCGSALWDTDLSGRKSWRYSPECVEEEFCELRLYGVLRSSAQRASPEFGVSTVLVRTLRIILVAANCSRVAKRTPDAGRRAVSCNDSLDGSWRAGRCTFHMQHGERPAACIRWRPPHC